MELEIYSPLEGQKLQEVAFNFAEIKEWLDGKLEHYNGVTYDDSAIKTAKTDRAALNKFKDALETRRKDMKKYFLEPYERFEAQVKELVAMIDKPIVQIDGQIKNYEERQKEIKYEQIREFYGSIVGDLKDVVSFESIENPRWKNVSYSLSNAYVDIETTLERIRGDIKTLTALEDGDGKTLVTIYLNSKYSLSRALQENERLKALKQAASKVVEKPRMPEVPNYTEATKPEPLQRTQPEAVEEQVYEVCFRCWLTQTQKQLVKQFLIDNNIKYGRV